jgi:hypothetical protein
MKDLFKKANRNYHFYYIIFSSKKARGAIREIVIATNFKDLEFPPESGSDAVIPVIFEIKLDVVVQIERDTGWSLSADASPRLKKISPRRRLSRDGAVITAQGQAGSC